MTFNISVTKSRAELILARDALKLVFDDDAASSSMRSYMNRYVNESALDLDKLYMLYAMPALTPYWF